MKKILLTVLAGLVLSGCGVPGPLERPGPMWGDDAAARERARLEQEREEAERRRREAEAAEPAPADAPAPQ